MSRRKGSWHFKFTHLDSALSRHVLLYATIHMMQGYNRTYCSVPPNGNYRTIDFYARASTTTIKFVSWGDVLTSGSPNALNCDPPVTDGCATEVDWGSRGVRCPVVPSGKHTTRSMLVAHLFPCFHASLSLPFSLPLS